MVFVEVVFDFAQVDVPEEHCQGIPDPLEASLFLLRPHHGPLEQAKQRGEPEAFGRADLVLVRYGGLRGRQFKQSLL